MNKVLYILRHAKSEWEKPYKDDWERTLNPRGLNDIDVMAKKLRNKVLHLPQKIYVSNSVRTSLTAQGLSQKLNWDLRNIVYHQELYHASEENLKYFIDKTDNAIQNIMLVGHNPGLTYLVNSLSEMTIDNLPTLGCVGILFNTTKWRDICRENSEFLFIDYPKLP